ncbi:MAG TPA: hypothetical protein VFI43_00505 [Nitrosospira sp.]|nr:hypothetical protein [Nitrosospira sp.]
MLKSRSREVHVWWPVPLAVVLWTIIIWAFGFLLTAPKIETKTPPPIDASFVELPEEKPVQKETPVPQKTPKLPPTPSRPQPRLGVNEPKLAKPVPRKGAPKDEAPATVARTPPAPAKDLMAYMNEARERRRAGGIFEDEPVEPKNVEAEPSEEELRMANVKRNLREPGASGIFQITRMGTRTAEFLFRAWRIDSSNPRREVVEVTAGPDGDIQRAVVKKMIELIREYHKGDFNWESFRLGHVVVLSSRPEDSRGLEDFLIREFFGDRAAPLPR